MNVAKNLIALCVIALVSLVLTAGIVYAATATGLNDELYEKYGSNVRFSSAYTYAQQRLVLEALQASKLTDITVFPQITFQISHDKKDAAVSNAAGVIWLDPGMLKRNNLPKLNQVIGHEIGHLFDHFCLLDEDRRTFASTRGIQLSDIARDWYGNYTVHLESTDSTEWDRVPAEYFAEVFSTLYFNPSNAVRTTSELRPTEEMYQFIREAYQTAIENKIQGTPSRITPNAQRVLKKIVSETGKTVPMYQLPSHFGPMLFLKVDTSKDVQEYVFTAVSTLNRNVQFNRMYSPNGYQQYGAYFSKSADTVIHQNGIDYTFLTKQGDTKDFNLLYDGIQLSMTNDPDLDVYDLISIMNGE